MTDDNTSALQEQLAELQKKLAESQELLAPLNDAEVELNSQRYQIQEAYKQQMAALNARDMELRDKKQKAQATAMQIENAMKQAQLHLAKIAEEEAAAKAAAEKAARESEKAAVLEKRFDMVTMGAKWREWAKDHQIKAGHYITENRKVILADPMGLGKTLSSVITADMSEGATKDASPEFPFLGIEKEILVPAQTVWTERGVEAALNNEWPFNLQNIKAYCEYQNIPNTIEIANYENDPFADYVEPKVNYESVPVKYRGRPIEVGAAVGFLAYDLTLKLTTEGYIQKNQAHYKTEIVDSVTRPVGRKILYFCPSPLLRNVREEWQEWAPHRNVTFIGSLTKAEQDFVFMGLPKLDQYVIIVNYEAWRRNKALLDKLIACEFDTIIVDEAHMVKDPKTAAYQGVRKVIDGCKADYVIPMTGTPILNRPHELFWILTLVNPQEFRPDTGGERDFLWRYCEEYWHNDDMSKPNRWRFKSGGLDLLMKKISKNILRRTKDQAGIVLPEKTVIYHELDLDEENYPEQAKARKHMRDYATIVVDEAKGQQLQATAMIALLTRLRQIETWPAGIVIYKTKTDPNTGKVSTLKDPKTGEKVIDFRLDVEESQKVDYIIRKEGDEWEGLIPDVVDEERVIVFSQFKPPLRDALLRRVQDAGISAAVFDGDTPQALRDEIRLDFDRSKHSDDYIPKYRVLLCNYKAAGVGLNLTGATQLITLDEEWNPGKRDQAWDRIHRIGQTHNVTINVIRVKNTIDDWLADIIDQKEAVVGGFEAKAELTTGDIKSALDSGLI